MPSNAPSPSSPEQLDSLYRHLKLTGQNTSIRVLDVLSGWRRTKEIQGELRVVNLDAIPQYEALSYT